MDDKKAQAPLPYEKLFEELIDVEENAAAAAEEQKKEAEERADTFRYFDPSDTLPLVCERFVTFAAQRGIALECNAKGLFGWQQAVGPEDCVLARYRELGGEYITTGSDSHAPDNIGAGIAQALDRLRAFGFSYVTDFENGTAIQHRL